MQRYGAVQPAWYRLDEDDLVSRTILPAHSHEPTEEHNSATVSCGASPRRESRRHPPSNEVRLPLCHREREEYPRCNSRPVSAASHNFFANSQRRVPKDLLSRGPSLWQKLTPDGARAEGQGTRAKPFVVSLAPPHKTCQMPRTQFALSGNASAPYAYSFGCHVCRRPALRLRLHGRTPTPAQTLRAGRPPCCGRPCLHPHRQ